MLDELLSKAGRPVARYCDVCVVDGSPAGLAAALELVRRGRSVIVIDSGGAPATAVEREAVRSYGGEILDGLVIDVSRQTRAEGGFGFRVELSGERTVIARRVVGAGDVAQPDIESIAAEDAAISTGLSAGEADWDHRYDGAQLWSGNPNGTLVVEASALTPGRALDVGAGEGGDALWLAEQGWQVTASDISRRGLDRVAAEAARRGLRVECLHADANAPDPFPVAAFDLVSAQYASIPRTPDGRGVANLMKAVAPSGTRS